MGVTNSKSSENGHDPSKTQVSKDLFRKVDGLQCWQFSTKSRSGFQVFHHVLDEAKIQVVIKGYLYPLTVANFAMPMACRWDMHKLMTLVIGFDGLSRGENLTKVCRLILMLGEK